MQATAYTGTGPGWVAGLSPTGGDKKASLCPSVELKFK